MIRTNQILSRIDSNLVAFARPMRAKILRSCSRLSRSSVVSTFLGRKTFCQDVKIVSVRIYLHHH